jgi:hypothetical protein
VLDKQRPVFRDQAVIDRLQKYSELALLDVFALPGADAQVFERGLLQDQPMLFAILASAGHLAALAVAELLRFAGKTDVGIDLGHCNN